MAALTTTPHKLFSMRVEAPMYEAKSTCVLRSSSTPSHVGQHRRSAPAPGGFFV